VQAAELLINMGNGCRLDRPGLGDGCRQLQVLAFLLSLDLPL